MWKDHGAISSDHHTSYRENGQMYIPSKWHGMHWRQPPSSPGTPGTSSAIFWLGPWGTSVGTFLQDIADPQLWTRVDATDSLWWLKTANSSLLWQSVWRQLGQQSTKHYWKW